MGIGRHDICHNFNTTRFSVQTFCMLIQKLHRHLDDLFEFCYSYGGFKNSFPKLNDSGLKVARTVVSLCQHFPKQIKTNPNLAHKFWIWNDMIWLQLMASLSLYSKMNVQVSDSGTFPIWKFLLKTPQSGLIQPAREAHRPEESTRAVKCRWCTGALIVGWGKTFWRVGRVPLRKQA